VCLDIVAGGELIGQVVANRYRADLEAAGHGSGRHGFAFVVPAGWAFAPTSVAVRRSLDGAVLPRTKELAQRVSRRNGLRVILMWRAGHRLKAGHRMSRSRVRPSAF
jgi:hypothetical protein